MKTKTDLTRFDKKWVTMSSLTKQLNGAIPVGIKYTTVGVRYNRKRKDDDGINFDLSFCENCGRVITNIFKIQDSTDTTARIYSVGSECVIALCGESWELSEDARKAKLKMKAAKWIWEHPDYTSIQSKHDTFHLYEKKVVRWEPFWKFHLSRQWYEELTGRTTADIDESKRSD